MIHDSYWRRLAACERRTEVLYRLILGLQRFMSQIQQTLSGLLGKG
jgi:hypothetical protein